MSKTRVAIVTFVYIAYIASLFVAPIAIVCLFTIIGALKAGHWLSTYLITGKFEE